jgi:hypothetical protein
VLFSKTRFKSGFNQPMRLIKFTSRKYQEFIWNEILCPYYES